jgi:hypothetical protein
MIYSKNRYILFRIMLWLLSLRPFRSFRGDAKASSNGAQCAPENFDISGSVLTDRPGMTSRRWAI